MAVQEFTLFLGTLHGWHGILLGLIGSVVFLVSGRQDLGLRAGVGGVFWFFLALFSAIGVICLALGSRIWGGALLGVTALCSESWLIHRWWRQRRSI